MAESTGRPVGRPKARVLDRAMITTAALDLVQAGGVHSLTMTRLAGALNVTPSALYNHASSKQEIMRWIQDHFMSRVDVSGFASGDWLPGLRSWAHSYRHVMAGQPELIPAIATVEVTDSPRTVAMYEAVTEALVATGWPSEACVPLIIGIEAFVFGTALNDNAPATIFELGQLAQSAPTFAAAVERSYGRGAADLHDTMFAEGVDALILRAAERAGVARP